MLDLRIRNHFSKQDKMRTHAGGQQTLLSLFSQMSRSMLIWTSKVLMMTRGAWQIMNAVVMQKNITYKAFSWLFFCCCWICCCSTSMFSSESSVAGFSSKFETCDGFVVKLRQKNPLRFDQIRSMYHFTISAELLSESFVWHS